MMASKGTNYFCRTFLDSIDNFSDKATKALKYLIKLFTF